MSDKNIILCILDGWGIAADTTGNAITQAKPPTFDYLWQNFPHCKLEAAGPDVGLPQGQDGNSETGHLNIGAGRIVFQDLALINMSIADGTFFINKALLDTVKHLQSFQSRLHIIGMIGNSGVHAYNEHLYALLLFAQRHNIKEVYLHLITDGRDSPPDDGLNEVKKVETEIARYKVGRIVSVMGRYYAMDRDQRLDRTKKAYDCLTGKGDHLNQSPQEFIVQNYDNGTFDEFIVPTALGDDYENTRIKPADAVIFYNFRTDRPRQLTEMFLRSGIPNLRFVTMTRYRKDFTNPVLFPTTTVPHTLGEVIANNSFNQLRAAETEKIAMVTYYFNGQSEVAFPGETHVFVHSPKIATYDLQPQMSTPELIKQFIENYRGGNYKLAVINIACPDMVAHTGKLDKTIEAIKASDQAIGQLVKLSQETGAYLFITADHGNAEELLNLKTGKVDTEHSTNPVPLIVYHPQDNHFKLADGKLGDIAPTILKILDFPAPADMTGNDLIVR